MRQVARGLGRFERTLWLSHLWKPSACARAAKSAAARSAASGVDLLAFLKPVVPPLVYALMRPSRSVRVNMVLFIDDWTRDSTCMGKDRGPGDAEEEGLPAKRHATMEPLLQAACRVH